MKKFNFFTLFLRCFCCFLIGDISAQAYQFPETKGAKRSLKVSVFDGSFLTSNCNPKIYYYRFKEGDKIEFNVSSKKNKKIKSIRVVQYPNFERYSNIDCADPVNDIFRYFQECYEDHKFLNDGVANNDFDKTAAISCISYEILSCNLEMKRINF